MELKPHILIDNKKGVCTLICGNCKKEFEHTLTTIITCGFCDHVSNIIDIKEKTKTEFTEE